jgi:hypothetical protein
MLIESGPLSDDKEVVIVVIEGARQFQQGEVTIGILVCVAGQMFVPFFEIFA